MRNLKDVPTFIEKALPIWMLIEISEALRDVFGRTIFGKTAFTTGLGGN